MGQDTAAPKFKASPVTCSRQHQIYLMFFPDLGTYGFGCGSCSKFSMEVQNNGNVLSVKVDRPAFGREVFENANKPA